MKSFPSFLFACSLLAAACDDDKSSNSKDEVQSGTFVGSAVTGLHYATATQSGLTDASGTFKYKSGESVTFSVGGTTLGSATGASKITAFTLFNVTPPTDAALARSIVYESDDNISDFERALNVAAFLIALDANGNPSDGIDLTGRDAALASQKVSLDVKTLEFVYQRLENLAAMTNLAWSMDLDYVLAHAYAGADIAASGSAVAKVVVDNGTDGTHERNNTFIYDAGSQMTAYRTDGGEDGDIDSAQEITRDASGHTTRTAFRFSQDDGLTLDRATVIASTFNAAGQLTVTTRSNVNGATSTLTQTRTYTYDTAGRLTGRSTVNTGSDTFTYAFDAATQTLTAVETFLPSEGSGSKYRTTITYDAAGREAVTTYASDSANDGDYEYAETTTNTFDTKGNVLTRVIVATDGGAPSYRETKDYTYDSNLRVTAITDATDAGNDTTIDSTLSYAITYDAAGRVATSTTKVSGVGIPLYVLATEVYTLDAQGRPSIHESKDYNASGMLTNDFTESTTYDASGRVASVVRLSAGSTPDTETYTYADVSNVVVAAFQQFLLD